ncbi:hypothetical protein GCM10023184_03300 [Flaviaesturariibacter amylovorans]|uniref:Uncharacterized protein n=1 Tax=Flaviaesturariibacter amylovorans TaxID=1084520 RepID=A0ABP8G7F5_9BACT
MQAEGDPDDGEAEHQSAEHVAEGAEEAAEDEPDQVAEEVHERLFWCPEDTAIGQQTGGMRIFITYQPTMPSRKQRRLRILYLALTLAAILGFTLGMVLLLRRNG